MLLELIAEGKAARFGVPRPPGGGQCVRCGRTWQAYRHRRSDALYCSASCRTLAWRDRKAGREPVNS